MAQEYLSLQIGIIDKCMPSKLGKCFVNLDIGRYCVKIYVIGESLYIMSKILWCFNDFIKSFTTS